MFSQNKQRIEAASGRLLDMPVERARIGCLVINGLRRVAEMASTLDACVTEDMPFSKHFFNELATLPQDDGSHWMNLLEDLALIFRAKQLAFPAENVSEGEGAILGFFEHSGEWHAGSLVYDWYWKALPQRLSS